MSAAGKILIHWEWSSMTGDAPAVLWGMCLTDTSDPVGFFDKNELLLTPPPQQTPAQPHDLIRDTPELLLVLEDPRAQPVAESSKRSKRFWLLEEKLGCCGGTRVCALWWDHCVWQEGMGSFIPTRSSWPRSCGMSPPLVCTAPPL